MQKTVALESRLVGLFSTFKMVFSNFLARILLSSNKLLTNRNNLMVDEISLFEKAKAFWKLMVRIRKTLCVKVVCWIAVVGNFLTLWLIFDVFPAFG